MMHGPLSGCRNLIGFLVLSIVAMLGGPLLLPASAATPGRITGTVTGASGVGLTGVSVTPYLKYGNMWSPTGSMTQTDAMGHYDMGGLAAGTYRLRFQDGSGVHGREFYDNATSVTEATDIVVSEGATVTGRNAQLATASHISGTVTAGSGMPLPGATVTAYQLHESGTWGPVASVDTTNQGYYDLGGLGAGTFRVGFQKAAGGYISEFFDNAAAVYTATDVVVGAAQTVPNTNAQLATYSHITGTVTGEDGTPLAGIEVRTFKETSWGWGQTGLPPTTTNTSGQYDIGGLTAGTYRIGFFDSRGNSLGEYYNDAATVGTSTDIVVTESATVSGKDAVLTAASHITGKVTNAVGVALSGVAVFVYQRSAYGWSSTAQMVRTNAAGDYDLGGLAAGTYRIGFSIYPGDYLTEYYDDAATVEAATDIMIGKGVTLAGRDAQLDRASHIKGRVTGPDGMALQGVSVKAYRDDPTHGWVYVSDVSTDTHGYYDLGNLPADTYRVGFSAWMGGYLDEYFNDANTVESAADIVVGVGESVAGKDAQLALGSTIKGTITGPDGAPLPNVGVTAYKQAPGGGWEPVSQAGTNSAGGYTLGRLRKGIYRLGFADFADDYVSEFWDNAATLEAANDIVVGEGATLTGKNAQLDHPADPTPTPTSTPTVTGPPSPTPTTTPVPVPDVAEQISAVAAKLSIQGKPKVGQTVKVSNLVVALRASVSYKFQWYAGSGKIKRATKARLKIVSAFKGKKLKVRVKITSGSAFKVVTIQAGKVT